ncbi:hypothetical protein [Pontibacter ummariensis]|nr:hypothetical protein [Pontibacter ummariensis]
MKNYVMPLHIISWLFGTLVLVVGILNMFLVHPVPGIAYLLLSLVYFPPVNALLQYRLGFSVPLVVKIVLGIFLIMFTLGVSDLGDMID